MNHPQSNMTQTKTNSKVVNRLMTEINKSRTFLREANERTTMTPIEEYKAWQDYGKDLERQKAMILKTKNDKR